MEGNKLLTKDELVAKAKELAESEDLGKALAEVRNLRKQWRKTGSEEESLYDKEMSDKFYGYLDVLNAKESQAVVSVEESKKALIAKAKEILNEKSFKKATAAMNELMDEWKGSGSAGKETDDALWGEFKAVRDEFFNNRRAYYDNLTEGFKKIAVEILLKDIPETLETRYDADDLLRRIKRILFTTNNSYDTREYAGETCVSYKINIAGESTPIYVPLRYIETEEDFNPYNELRQVEKRIRCNFHNTTSCSVAIDSSIKGVGLRTNAIRTNAPTFKSGKFEDYATLPTYILIENDPNVIAQKKVEAEEIRKEINEVMCKESNHLTRLRDIYRDLKKNKDELFCNQQLFNEILDQIKDIFDTTASIIGKIKEAHEMLSGKKTQA